MKIITGKYKGKNIITPNNIEVRPTKNRVREAIFSTIHFQLRNALFLDLFAGSGVFAIEAVSRYAMKSYVVDKNVLSINKNIDNLKINNIEVFKTEVIDFLLSAKGKKFDIIFLDPPYNKYDLYNESLKLIANNNILNELGTIIIETDNPNNIIIPNSFVINKTKKYGRTFIMFLSNNI